MIQLEAQFHWIVCLPTHNHGHSIIKDTSPQYVFTLTTNQFMIDNVYVDTVRYKYRQTAGSLGKAWSNILDDCPPNKMPFILGILHISPYSTDLSCHANLYCIFSPILS